MTEAVVLGVIDGLTIGLLAVGIVLVYKANRFINLAHAQLGTLSAVLLAKFVLDWSLSWWPRKRASATGTRSSQGSTTSALMSMPVSRHRSFMRSRASIWSRR